jgi:hypothetical protein
MDDLTRAMLEVDRRNRKRAKTRQRRLARRQRPSSVVFNTAFASIIFVQIAAIFYVLFFM